MPFQKASKLLGKLTSISSIGRSLSTPARSAFYVPANDSKKLSKIYSTNADCVVLDCEDGVALNRKVVARDNICNLFSTDQRVQNNNRYAVRINAPQTDLANEDIKSIFNLGNLPRTVFVPKTNFEDDIEWLLEKIHYRLSVNNFVGTNGPDGRNPINFYFYMESAASLINLQKIIETFIRNSQNYRGIFKLEGFVFGSDDFCADIGAERTSDASELIYARQKLVTYCKAFKLKAIDMVYIDYKDLDGLKKQCEQGARMGFTGKQVIHPGQVDVTQTAFSPSDIKIKWANGLIEAFKAHQNSGAGAFTYEGQMIDMPSVLQAENILAIKNKVKNDQ